MQILRIPLYTYPAVQWTDIHIARASMLLRQPCFMSFHNMLLTVNDINAALQSVKCFISGDIAAHLTAVNCIHVDVFLSSLLIKIF